MKIRIFISRKFHLQFWSCSDFSVSFRRSHRVLSYEAPYRLKAHFLPRNYFHPKMKIRIFTSWKFHLQFDHARTLVSLLEGLIEFSHKRHLIGWRHNFYPGIFFSQKWKFGYLPPENSTFNFDHARTLVPLSKGLIKFSHMRHLIGWRHNFYTGIFSAKNENSDIYLLKIPP
jgi:hypothetical protein